jgi:hypothetical protein
MAKGLRTTRPSWRARVTTSSSVGSDTKACGGLGASASAIRRAGFATRGCGPSVVSRPRRERFIRGRAEADSRGIRLRGDPQRRPVAGDRSSSRSTHHIGKGSDQLSDIDGRAQSRALHSLRGGLRLRTDLSRLDQRLWHPGGSQGGYEPALLDRRPSRGRASAHTPFRAADPGQPTREPLASSVDRSGKTALGYSGYRWQLGDRR